MRSPSSKYLFGRTSTFGTSVMPDSRPTTQARVTTSHFVEFDRVHHGRPSIALCSNWCDEGDISNDPTCPDCRTLLQLTTDIFEPKEESPT